MGIVFGMTGSAEPAYNVISAGMLAGGELRFYTPFIVAEVPNPPGRGNGDGFSVLAKYIGVFGEPANEVKRAMAMTAPVTMVNRPESMAMTAPVTMTSRSGTDYMGFVLPFEIQDLDQAPRPLDSRITLRKVPARLVAVRTYSGWHSDEVARGQYIILKEELKKHGLCDEHREDYEVSQYHPPFTLPFLRRNEIWCELKQSPSLPAVGKLLASLALKGAK